MPPAPKASQSSSKKSGASKAKGAVRAKTGCYTCRIRRKKCDEERTDRDTCKTCDRLRLECLGFGAKRPEWLRENHNVVALREQIKVFLASQGLIKGHSGTNSRPPEGPGILRLTAEEYANQSGSGRTYHSSDSESGQARSLSMSDDEDRHHRLGPITSSVRDEPESAWFGPGAMNQYPSGNYMHQRTASPPPYSSANAYDERLPQHHSSYPPSVSLDDSSLISFPNATSPALRSGFSRLYHDPIVDWDTFEDPLGNINFSPWDFDSLSLNPSGPTYYPLYQTPVTYMPTELVDESVRKYVLRIAEIQYLLGDKAFLPELIWQSCQQNTVSQRALKLLTSIYYRRQQHPRERVLGDSEMHAELRSLLDELGKGRFDNPDDAIAALHGVSMFLFDGGHGAWLSFLKLATEYVKKVLHSQTYSNPKDALLWANVKDAFIVKTAIWFDVLASITTCRVPHFLEEIRAMFDPSASGIHDVAFDRSPQCSMMSPMGCENRVVWAIAEVSALAVWKDTERLKRRLNIGELVRRAAHIDGFLDHRPFESMLDASASQDDRDLEHTRYLASEIFRCTARLFLATVKNDDNPQVQEIQDAVDNIIVAFRNLFISGLDVFNVSRSVVRSTVFGIYLCGAMTMNKAYRNELLLLLDRESNGRNGEGVGNCASIRKMLEELWKLVGANPSRSVPWRQILSREEILLV